MAEKEPASSAEGNPPHIEVEGQDETDAGKRKSKSKKPKQDPRLIVDGLQLFLKGSKQPFVSYTYALTTLMESGTKIEPKMLTTEPVESQHIRLHTLQPGDTLTSIAAAYRKSYTVAVILVNTADGLELPTEVVEEVTRTKKTAFPIALVSAEDGKSLKELVSRHETGELSAKLEVKNQAHIELKAQPKGGSSPGSESTLTLNTRKRGFSFRRKGRRMSVINLKEEIKNLVFPVTGPVCVSEDEEKFKAVMTVFYQYEQMMMRGGQIGAGALFNKLMKHIDEMFARDFPFYLLVAYRVQKKQTYYLCDELRPFVRMCVDKFERLEPVSIVKTLETFFLKVEDFNLMFESDNSTHSIYQLLEEACIVLMTFSFSQKSQEGAPPLHRAIYYRMLWISTAYKCHMQRNTGPRETVNYWREHLTAAENFTQLDTDVIQSLKRGVEFGRHLQLSEETSFSSSHMAEVLTARGLIRPFHQLKEFVIVLEPYIQPEDEFVSQILTRPRECYKQNKGGLRKAHGDKSLLIILQDGLGFLDTVLEVSRKRQWSSDALNTELKKWLTILLTPVEVTGEGAEACLKELLSHKTAGVTKHYQETVKRELVVKLKASLSKLSVEEFLHIYKAHFIWPPWIVQSFLEQYKIPKGVKICSDTWKDFFAVFVERFTDAKHHKFVLEFFKSVAQHYLDQSRPKEFLLDLLRLDVPHLFVLTTDQESLSSQQSESEPTDVLARPVPEEFSEFLSDYIQRNSLRDDLLDDIETIWKLIADHSDFQQLVLQVLQQELIPESGSLHGPLSQPMKFLLKQCVTTICSGLDTLHDLSSRLTFCWGVVGSCCQKMPLTENLDWISVYYSVIDQLGRIYSVYQSSQDNGDTKSILTEDSMSSDVTECTAEGVGIFFKWIAQAQQVLGIWRDKLTSMEVNYDELMLYSRQYNQIGRAAMSLSSDGLVVDNHFVKMMKQDFLQQFELLNMFLLRYADSGWCSLLHILSQYGVSFPPNILLAIKKYVIFPGEGPSMAKRAGNLENPIPSSVSGNFRPPGELQLEITREMSVSALKKLVQAIATFLEPIKDLDFLTFFFLFESEIFDKYLKLQLKKLDSKEPSGDHPPPSFSLLSISLDVEPVIQGVNVSQFGKALEITKDFVLRLIVGNASYVEIVAEGSLSLRSLDIDEEFRILGQYVDFAKIEAGSAKGLDGVKAMLQLFQYTRHIQVIHSVCQQYNLVNCLEDPNLKELVGLVETLEENRDNLTAAEAIDKMKKVTKVLCIEPGQSLRFLDLFSAVQDSADFHRFVVQEKQFVGKQGQDLFRQQFQLITTQLQHEEYNEVVLNHLFAAFSLITPFTDTEQDFTKLMTSVAILKAVDARRQLETVNRNINLIRLWFSRAEGDTLQGVSSELSCILKSGHYTFLFSTSSSPLGPASETGSIQLHYIPHSSLYQNVGEVRDTPSLPTEDRWNEEAISDFVRKLGFLDAGGTVTSEINHFLHINQTATKLLGLYSKLRELGHPNFLHSPMKTNLRCSCTLDEANEMVSEASQLLSMWEKEVANLRTEYEQLLYFSIPKLLHLYQNLTAHTPNPNAIVRDVGFLFENKPHVKAQLRESVKELLETKPHSKRDGAASTPMHIVGAFLSSLFGNLALSSNSLKRRRRGSVGSMVSRSSSSGQSTHILHSCAGFTQAQLLRLIISIYGGVPEAFEVYHCRTTSTEEELRLFMNPKRATKRPFQYLILEVNKLPYRLQEALVRIHFDLKQAVGGSDEVDSPCVHFVETGISLLQEMPWLLRMDYKGAEPPLEFAEASSSSKNAALHSDDFRSLQLVYGHAGDGKTHYIENQMAQCPEYLRIAVNEAFTPLSTIQKLCSVEFEEPECAVFFNFTLLPPGEAVSKDERKHYEHLIESINWFFFDLFILGYVEDPVTGQSFRFPGGMKIAVYVEVPSRVRMDPEDSLAAFYEDIPALGLLGTKYFVEPATPFVVDPDVQLVCKYLKAFRNTKIDRLYKDAGGLFSRTKPGVPVKFSLDPDLSESDCRKLLDKYTPQHMKVNKATQKLFIKYMKRRCAFLDTCPAFNYNPGATEYMVGAKGEKKKNDTTQLGSTLMDTMLKEVSDFCDPLIRENWALKPHHQLLYDFKDGGGSIGLMSLHPEQISKDDIEKYKKIGVQMPSMFELYSRECLDSFLSRALDVPLNEQGRLSPIDDCRYVLTLDFALKMLSIHERAQGGVPVIIEGETGVGKTALIEMLSRLWNYSLFNTWNIYKDRIMNHIKGELQKLPPSSFKKHAGSMESVLSIAQSTTTLREDDLMQIAEIPLPGPPPEDKQFYSIIRDHLMELAGDPLLSVLEPRPEDCDDRLTVPLMVASAQYKDNPKDITRLLYKFLNCRVKTLFFKLNVHAALQPAEIIEFFLPIFEQAKMLQKAYERFTTQVKVPFITVFLDEVNTSSCLGLFKEVIIDRTLDGEPIPSNVFIVGACNPHRGNSLAAHGGQETWIRGTYYVRQLHPTIQCLMWDYGALGEQQERDYILAKMKLSNQDTANADLANLTELIVLSQNLMRKYALEQLKNCGLSDAKASEYSRSCVSQRDIQRVFTFYEWLHKMYMHYKPAGHWDYNSRAVAVALGLVYYLRLNNEYRKKYREILDHEMAPSRLSFSKCFREELNWYINHIDLPEGIAKTQALKENLFATIVCTMTHTPLVIVGSPGSSKTLSFNLTLANLKGQESKVRQFRETEIFKSLDPQIYQCSRRTTSNEISTVFNRAINRQRSHQSIPLPVYCVVFMDEAGLPEERHESLKVLHYYLDTQEVSFVAISNHVLDAAKTNRAVSLFRPEATREELTTLAKGCLCTTPERPPPELRQDMNVVANFCAPYLTLMSKERFARFFGLRDFINFISYLRRNRKDMLHPQLVMEALERNFNGVSQEDFDYICKLFLRAVHSNPSQVMARNILDILCCSFEDHPDDPGAENEMRYKLIIDSSDDGSLVRLLFSTGVLNRENTRVYVCSDFPGDAELQKVNTIAAIRHSVTEGHTVVLSQTDSIHESFYDLFNRRFHRIDAASGRRYYANIAIGAHIKPCRVHQDFDCVVVVKQSEVESIPPPFLNRFEKYYLSHELVLEATLSTVPVALAAVVKAALEKAKEFVEYISGTTSLYGLQEETLFSLLMSLLPPLNHEYSATYSKPSVPTSYLDVKNRLMESLLHALKENAGFQIPSVSYSKEEARADTAEVMEIIMLDSEFSGQVLRLMSMESNTEATEVIYNAVVEALHVLHNAKSLEQAKEVSANACMVISMLTHWLVRYLCKRVMQLMTSEALCMHHRKIPASYIQAYLNHQHHFSLKELLETQCRKLDEEDPSAANKLVCFMRSSSPLHQLPAQYPTPEHHHPSPSGNNTILLKELVLTNTKELVVHKMSSITSFTSVNELLKSFTASSTQRVLLIIVNMEDTTKELVNHLRIMIEEAESKNPSQKKLFAILLHFQTCRPTSPCYPVMFLPGWDFNYLEMIGYSPQGGVLDIRDWFRQCYGTSSMPDHSIAPHLSALLHEAIPAISSRVCFRECPNSPFNTAMKIPERNRALEKLFFDKGVGEVLCKRFNSYWTPSVMVEYLEKAALHAQQHESPNVIDNLQTNFKSLFVDFLVYMVYEMNKGMNIDVLFDSECTQDTVKLFLDILRVMPIPKLPEITMLRIAHDTAALKESKGILSPPKFPYFAQVSTGIERLVDQAQRDLNQNIDGADDLLSVLQCSEHDRAQTVSSLFKSLQTKLNEVAMGDERSPLSVGLRALLSLDSHWFKYLEDFTHQKLLLEFGRSGISDKVRSAAFGNLENRTSVQRLAILHVYVHIHKLNLAKVVSILRPLDQVEDAVLTLTSMAAARATNPAQSLLASVEDGSDLLGCSEALSSFIISTLFNAISGISMTYFAQGERQLEEREVSQVKLWFRAYRDVMSMPSLREHLYVSRSATTEAQHSTMHLLYLMVRSRPAGDVGVLQCGLHMFNQLFTKFFTTRSDLQGTAPRLEDLAYTVLEGLPQSPSWDLQQARGILEGLFSHFFSAYRTVFHSGDMEWFLELANGQKRWQATYIMDGIYEFEYSEDLNAVLGEPEAPEELTLQSLATSLPMSVFKFYLRRIILTSIKSTEDPIHSVMLFFNKTEAHKLITKVLCSTPDLGRAGPYIPTYYQLCDYISPSPSADNKLMQQPLCHLYFLTVMEDLKDSSYGLSGLVKTIHNIAKSDHWFEGQTCNCCDDQSTDNSTPGCQLVLLHIEEQALTQVLIREVARHMDPTCLSKVNALFAVLTEVNAILDDKWMGGGDVGGHGLTLAMHLLREKKSFQKFVTSLTTEYNTLSDGINCLQPFNQALPSPAPPVSSVRPDSHTFMPYQDLGSEFTALYTRVVNGMNAVHSSHGSSAKSREKEFTRLADECLPGEMAVTTPSGSPGTMNKMAAFRTILWLATYNDFFVKKRQSKSLAQVVGNMSKKIGLTFSQLIQCFLDPELMQRGPSGREPVRLPLPLLGLFTPTTHENPSLCDLQKALVHLITSVLAAPPNTTNLWCLLFDSDHVIGSYLPGFMYDSPVGPDARFYDLGVELTGDGFYARMDTVQHVTRGTLGLHSLYFLLWANFSSFFVALLTQPQSAERLSGKLFSSNESVAELCCAQMMKTWDLLCSGLSVSEEERSLLVSSCLNRLIEQQLTKVSDLRGRLDSPQHRDQYESNWHTRIFTPSWNALKNGFESASTFLTMPVIKDIIKLDARYPWAPGVPSLTDMVLSSNTTDDSSHPLYPLSQFVVEYPRLRVGVDLLPSLLELYQWLHTELSYAVSYGQATTITLGRLSKVLTKHSMLTGVPKLKEMFNRYVQLTGCTGDLGPVTLGDDTPLLHLLSCCSEHCTDLLFTVIKDVITFLNHFFESLLRVLKSSAISESLFPSARPRVPVMEFVHHYMLIGQAKSGSDLLQLIHGRTILPIAYPSNTDAETSRVAYSYLPGQLSALIDLLPLQEDILSLCIVGMPLIDTGSIDSVRLPFKFKEDSSTKQQLKLQDYAIDLESVAMKLPKAFKRLLDDTYRKRLEYEFHSAGYHTVMEVIIGLRTAIGHLIKDVSEGQERTDLMSQKLPEYLISLYEFDPQDSTTDVFHEIGINSLSQAQHACLNNLSLDQVFNTRNLFVGWAEDGLYDFCSLPFGVKKHMSVPDEDAVSQMPGHFDGSPADLLKTLRSFVEVLVHLEPSIVKAAVSTPQKGLVHYLEKLKVCNNIETIRKIIPATIKLENYVALRVAIRRLMTKVQATVSQSELVTPEPTEEKWNEFIIKFWEDWLPKFRRHGYNVRVPTATKRPAETTDVTESYSSLLDELMQMEDAEDTERNILEAFAEKELNLEGSILEMPGMADSVHVEESMTVPFTQPEISDEELQKLAKKVSVQQVVEFLESVKLDQYATTFEESEISGELLLQFQDEELEEMEIDSALDRLKIAVFFKRHLLQSEGIAQEIASPDEVAKILGEYRQLRPYAKSFLESEMDSELILSASDEVFRELGVEKGAHRLMIRSKFMKTEA